MASYKKLAEERAEQIRQLQLQVDNMASLDGMVEAITDKEAKEVLTMFADRAKNRAELVLLIRVLSRL
jgi:hypothetical protein